MFLVRDSKETNLKYRNRIPVKRVRTEGSSNDGTYCTQQMFLKQLYHISEKHGGASVASEKPSMILSTYSSDSSETTQTPPPTQQILPKRKFGDKVKIHISTGDEKNPEKAGTVEHCAAFESWSSFWSCGDFLGPLEKDKDETKQKESERKRNDHGRVPSIIFFSCNPSHPTLSESYEEDSLVELPSSSQPESEVKTGEDDELDNLVNQFNEGFFGKIGEGEETSTVESYLDNVWVISSYVDPNVKSDNNGEMSLDSSIITRSSH